MAITIVKVPDPITPVYNDNYYIVNDTNASNLLYQYIFKIYNETGATLLHTEKRNPEPITYNGYFSPNTILKNLFEYNSFHANQIGVSSSITNENIIGYSMSADYSYIGGSGTEVTGTINLNTTFPKYVFNGVYDHNKFITNYDIANYLPDPTTTTIQKALSTEQLNHYVSINDFETISMVADNPNIAKSSIGFINVTVYDSGSNQRAFFNWQVIGPNFDPASITNDKIIHFGCGPWNLINVQSGSLYSWFPNSASAFPIVQPGDTKYEVIWQASGSAQQISQTYTYYLEDTTYCSNFDRWRIIYKTPLGGYNYITADNESEKTLSIEPGVYGQVYEPIYQQDDRGRTIYYMDAGEAYTLTTRPLTQVDVNDIYDLVKSADIYLNYYDSTLAQQIFIPVVLNPEEYAYQLLRPQKEAMYQLKFIGANQTKVNV